MNRAVQNAIGRYMSRIAGADSADTLDPTYHRHLATMQRLLEIVDMAMEDEGIEERSRARVIQTVVYGAPDEYAAHERMQRHEVDLEMLSRDVRPRAYEEIPDWPRKDPA